MARRLAPTSPQVCEIATSWPPHGLFGTPWSVLPQSLFVLAVYGRTLSATFGEGSISFAQAAPGAPTEVSVALPTSLAASLSAADFAIFEQPLLTDIQSIPFGIAALEAESGCSSIGSATDASWPVSGTSFISSTVSLFGAASLLGKSVGLRSSAGDTVACATIAPFGRQTSALITTIDSADVRGFAVLMQPALPPASVSAPVPIWEGSQCVDPTSGVRIDGATSTMCTGTLRSLGLSLDLTVMVRLTGTNALITTDYQLGARNAASTTTVTSTDSGYWMSKRMPGQADVCDATTEYSVLYEHPEKLSIGRSSTSISVTIPGVADSFSGAEWIVSSSRTSAYDYSQAGMCAAAHDDLAWGGALCSDSLGGGDVREVAGIDATRISCSGTCAAAVLPFEHGCSTYVDALSDSEQRNWRTLSYGCTHVPAMSLLADQTRCEDAATACTADTSSGGCSKKMEFFFHTWARLCAETSCSNGASYTARGDCCPAELGQMPMVADWRTSPSGTAAAVATALVDCLDTLQQLDLFSYDILESRYAGLLSAGGARGPGGEVVSSEFIPAVSTCAQMSAIACAEETRYANVLGSCVDKPICSDTAFMSSPGDGFTDRTCQDVTACTSTEYEAVEATSSANARCEPISPECATEEYESAAPTPSTDRACVTIRACGPTQFESEAPTADSNRVCTFLRECNPVLNANEETTEFESVEATASTDRECATRTVCVVGTTYRTVAGSAQVDTICASVSSVCSADSEVQLAAPTIITDRVCATSPIAIAEPQTRSGTAESDVTLSGEGVTRPVILAGIAAAVGVDPKDVTIKHVCSVGPDTNTVRAACDTAGGLWQLGMKQTATLQLSSSYPGPPKDSLPPTHRTAPPRLQGPTARARTELTRDRRFAGWVTDVQRCLKVTIVDLGDSEMSTCTATGYAYTAARCLAVNERTNAKISTSDACTSDFEWSGTECTATATTSDTCTGATVAWFPHACTGTGGTRTFSNEATCTTYADRHVHGSPEKCTSVLEHDMTTTGGACTLDGYTEIDSITTYLQNTVLSTMDETDPAAGVTTRWVTAGGRRQLGTLPGGTYSVTLEISKQLADQADDDITEVSGSDFASRLQASVAADPVSGLCSDTTKLTKDTCTDPAVWTATAETLTQTVSAFETKVDFTVSKAVTADEVETTDGLRAALIDPAAITAGFTSSDRICADNTAWSFTDTVQTAACDGTTDGRIIEAVIAGTGAAITGTSFTLTAVDANIAAGQVVTGTGIVGTVTVVSIDGTIGAVDQLVLSPAQTLSPTTTLTFTAGCGLNGDSSACAHVGGDCLFRPAQPQVRKCDGYINFNPTDLACTGGSAFRCLTAAGTHEKCISWDLVGNKATDCESGNDEHLSCTSTTAGYVSVPVAAGSALGPLGCYMAPCTGGTGATVTGVASDCTTAGGTVGATISNSGWSYRTHAPLKQCNDPTEGGVARRECPLTCGTCADSAPAAGLTTTAVSTAALPLPCVFHCRLRHCLCLVGLRSTQARRSLWSTANSPSPWFSSPPSASSPRRAAQF